MTDTSFKPDRDCQQRITSRRIASLAAALSALALMAGICSLRPRWQQEIGRLPINLGTAQMQAEAMALALAIRQSPPFPPPPPPVPAAALAGAQRMVGAVLRALREHGCGATVHGPTRTYDHVAYLTRPVFSVEGQWAMIAVARDSCSDDFVYRELVVLHREQGRWMAEPPERGLGGVWDGRILRPWTYNH